MIGHEGSREVPSSLLVIVKRGINIATITQKTG